MFELVELPKQKIKIYGKEFEISKPTVKQIKAITKTFDAKSDDVARSTDQLITFLSGLGLPSDLMEDMPAEHFNALVEYVLGVKKN